MKLKQFLLATISFGLLAVALFVPQISLRLATLPGKKALAWLAFFGLYALLICLYFWVLKKDSFHKLSKNDWVAIIVGYFTLTMIKLVYADLSQWLYHQTDTKNDNLIRAAMGHNQTTALMIVIIACIFAPLCEEMLFRGIFMKLFWPQKFFLPIIVSGLLFGLAHSNFNILGTLLYSALGWTLAFVYKHTKNLSASLTLHVLNNAPVILVFFLGIH